MMSDPKEIPTETAKLGKIELAPEVLQIIAGLSASQVEGVAALSGGVVDDINQFLGRKNLRQGVKVDLGDQTVIQVSIVVHYGYHLMDVATEVQQQVKETIEEMTSVSVDQVIVHVEGLKFSQTDKKKENEQTHRVK
jgi:uncharacterized alkaline shock family protein YloU